MRTFQLTFAIFLLSASGMSPLRAEDEPGEIRLSKEAVRALLTPAREVSVVGHAHESVVPDVADISIGVTSARPTVAEAVSINNKAMAELIDAIKRRGVAAKDLQTSQLSITPQYSRPAESKPDVPLEATIAKVVGYEVSNTLRVTVRDLSKTGDLLDTALKSGSNQMYGINFRIADREPILADLRAKAFDSARQKANAYAKRAGMELGPVIQITEADASWPDAPPFAPGFRMAAPMAAPAPSMPVSAGEQEVSLSVTVIYELRLPK